MTKDIKVTKMRAVARYVTTIDDRNMSYAGVKSLLIEDSAGSYSIEIMVPGEPNTIKTSTETLTWKEVDYAIRIEADNAAGSMDIDQELMGRLKEILCQVGDEEIKVKNKFGDEVSNEQIREMVTILIDQLDYVPQSLEGGIATKANIEKARKKAREVPPLSRS